MPSSFRLNPNLLDDLEDADQLDPALQAVGEAALARAQALAAAEAYETGDYLRGLDVEVGTPPGPWVGSRRRGFRSTGSGRVARLQARDWKSHWVEFGWTDQAGVHHPGKAILRRAVEATGLEVAGGGQPDRAGGRP